MANDSAVAHLRVVLEQRSKRISKPSGTVLFRCGEKASGMFVIFRGKVSLEAGDRILAYTYGPGGLVGLPSTITRRSYTMTATVTEDSELGLLSPENLDSLLHDCPELYHELLMILGNRMSENLALVSTLVKRAA